MTTCKERWEKFSPSGFRRIPLHFFGDQRGLTLRYEKLCYAAAN